MIHKPKRSLSIFHPEAQVYRKISMTVEGRKRICKRMTGPKCHFSALEYHYHYHYQAHGMWSGLDQVYTKEYKAYITALVVMISLSSLSSVGAGITHSFDWLASSLSDSNRGNQILSGAKRLSFLGIEISTTSPHHTNIFELFQSLQLRCRP